MVPSLVLAIPTPLLYLTFLSSIIFLPGNLSHLYVPPIASYKRRLLLEGIIVCSIAPLLQARNFWTWVKIVGRTADPCHSSECRLSA